MYSTPQHHHHPSQYHHQHGGGDTGEPELPPETHTVVEVFEQLCNAYTFKSVLHHYHTLCQILKLKPTNFRNFYPKLKSNLQGWKAKAIWSKFDKRSSHECYDQGNACSKIRVLVIGAGPCGLRTAIEAQLLGAKVVVVEKRDSFSRNNVLHLWPFVINDLKQLGAKKFYGKFCVGAIDHISIHQLQCILLKVALLLGVEVFENTGFEELVEPSEEGATEKHGWRARLSPPEHPTNQYEFDVLIGADGKCYTVNGFKRKELRGKLAIAITANFINKHTKEEARVQEISGVAYIFDQKFFKQLYAEKGIELENIVYYKDETHYFVMTAEKLSLLNKGVLLQDMADAESLLHPNNVNFEALQEYAKEAANFSTNYQLPHTDFAINHNGKPDVAVFDFTSMFAADNACRVVERRGHKLLMGLVGDSLLEPFWPTGSGCARGFLSAFDASWMIRSWSNENLTTLEVLAERESIYRLLAQTTSENLNKDHSSYTLDPKSRYPTMNRRAVLPFHMRSLFDSDDPEEGSTQQKVNQDDTDMPKKRKERGKMVSPQLHRIYVGKSIEDLNNMVGEIKSSNPKLLVNPAKEVLKQAYTFDEKNDEENAYVLFMKYFSVVASIKKHAEYKKNKRYYDSLIDPKITVEVISRAENLQESLEQRYNLLDDAVTSEIIEEKEFNHNLKDQKEIEKRKQQAAREAEEEKSKQEEASSGEMDNPGLHHLYMGTSMKDLNDMVDEIPSENPKLLVNTAQDILKEAYTSDERNDEEKAYVLFMRYFYSFVSIKKHEEYKKNKRYYDSLMDPKTTAKVIARAENLQESLERRYHLLNTSVTSERIEENRCMYNVEDQNEADKRKQQEQARIGLNVDEGTITCQKLYCLVKEKCSSFLILDIRPSDHFNETQMKINNVINIPEELLKTGVTAAHIGSELSPQPQKQWLSLRHKVDFLIICDWETEGPPLTQPINTLIDAMLRWDPGKQYASRPWILKGGYGMWHFLYPIHTTNPHFQRPAVIGWRL